MPRPESVVDICQPSDSGSGDDDGLGFIWFVGGQQTEIYEVWTFGDNRITPEVHPTARVDVGAFVGKCVATNYLTENGLEVPMFGRKPKKKKSSGRVVCRFLWTLENLRPSRKQ